MTVLDISLVCGIMFLSSIVRSALGFGEALIAMPLLVFVVSLQVASPLVALVSTLNAMLILAREWRMISFRDTGVLIVTALVGIWLGQMLLNLQGYEGLVKLLLACVILVFSIWSLWSEKSFTLKTDRLAPVFGFVSGVLGGAYNTAGPPLVMFGTLRQWPTERFRANLQSYFLVGGTAILLSHFYHGRVTSEVVKLFALIVPLVFVASMIGRRITAQVQPAQFLRLVHFGLLLIAVLLLGTTLAEVF